jgi:hypothetical protein
LLDLGRFLEFLNRKHLNLHPTRDSSYAYPKKAIK